MFPFIFLRYFMLPVTCWGVIEDMDIVFQWNHIEFEYPEIWARQGAIDHGSFVPENVIPIGFDIHRDRMIIVLPRLRSGVPASLAYLNLADQMDNPVLKPYPTWAAHQISKDLGGLPPEIVSPRHIAVDKCDRLWFVDSGIINQMEDTYREILPPRLCSYNLTNDYLIFCFEIPQNLVKFRSHFTNLIVEEKECNNSFVFIADTGMGALVVYSLETNKFWRIKHQFFKYDFNHTQISVGGNAKYYHDGVMGLALTPIHPSGTRILYFQALASVTLFAINTAVLHNPNKKTFKDVDFILVGKRKEHDQSVMMALDQDTNTLFYTLLNHNAIGYWNTRKSYTEKNMKILCQNDVTLLFPNDVKIGPDGKVYVMSNRLPFFADGLLDINEVNFRIMSAKIDENINEVAQAAEGSNQTIATIDGSDPIRRVIVNNSVPTRVEHGDLPQINKLESKAINTSDSDQSDSIFPINDELKEKYADKNSTGIGGINNTQTLTFSTGKMPQIHHLKDETININDNQSNPTFLHHAIRNELNDKYADKNIVQMDEINNTKYEEKHKLTSAVSGEKNSYEFSNPSEHKMHSELLSKIADIIDKGCHEGTKETLTKNFSVVVPNVINNIYLNLTLMNKTNCDEDDMDDNLVVVGSLTSLSNVNNCDGVMFLSVFVNYVYFSVL